MDAISRTLQYKNCGALTVEKSFHAQGKIFAEYRGLDLRNQSILAKLCSLELNPRSRMINQEALATHTEEPSHQQRIINYYTSATAGYQDWSKSPRLRGVVPPLKKGARGICF